ncbi:hypothetical protein HF086_014580 [Spodoptera exigua]|uniref:G-protein coupled receptors family 1 profile domain-containing protein n=1 Tax=Spodoptera exigua TaxID=7107 RepID=A0A922MB06_SPOEX|nr:hypothetical protein HF086_014580 [Spodoptera exigua]
MSTHYYYSSLCIADFLFCAIVLPFAISGFWTRTWSHGGALCKLVPFLRYGNVGVSLLSIALITLNRYIMIAHHSWYSRVYRKHNIAIMIVFSWMFSYGMQIPTLVGVWGKFDYDPELGTCSIMPDDNGRSAKTAFSEQRMREHQRAQHTSPGTLNNSTDKRSTIKDNRETKARRNEWRITKMVLAIFLSFLVCYLPITIAKVADNHVHYPVFHIAGYLLLYASACVNPIIYVIMNAQYRAAYAAALCCPLARLSGLTSGAEMERASRVQLQQHTNGAQPSVTGGVQSRPSGQLSACRPWRKISAKTPDSHSAGPAQGIGPATETVSFGPKIGNRHSGHKIGSLQSIHAKTDTRPQIMGSQQSIGAKSTGSAIRPLTGSQLSLGPKVTRFQIDDLRSDRQTNV